MEAAKALTASTMRSFIVSCSRPLSTDELGRIAAGCLIERLKGAELPPRQILLSGRLVPRGSSVHAAL